MAKKVRVRINSKGARQLLNGSEMTADMDRRAKAVVSAANETISASAVTEGFRGDGRPGKSRARALIGTTDLVSRAYNNKYNSLLKGLEAGK